MNKKVLVLTLALIVAFAGSAMAEVKIGGDFTATVKQENFKVFKEKYTLTPKVSFKITASNSSVTTDTEVVETTVVDEETGETVSVLETQEKSYTNWDFTARLNNFDGGGADFKLDRYKLELNDQYFDAWVWGREYVLTKKATKFDFIAASSGKDESADRARLAVPVMDLATVTFDFSGDKADGKGNSMLAFVDGEVEGFNVGLAYARTDWTPDSATNNIVAYGGGEFVAGEYVLDSSVAAGVTLGDDLGFALGLGAETDLTEEIAVDASVKFRNEEWAGGGFAKEINETKAVVLGAGTTYEVTNLQVTADVEQTFVKDNNSNVIELGAKYRFGEKVGFKNLFNNAPANGLTWYQLDAPAIGVYADIADFKFTEQYGTEFRAEVAAPVVENMVWAKATGKYGYLKYADDTDKDADDKAKEKYDTGYVVGGELYIKPIEKLTVRPSVSYASIGSVLDLKAVAAYKIGFSDATLTFTAQRVTAEDIQKSKAKSLLEAKVTVPF